MNSQNVFSNLPQNLYVSLVWGDVILCIPTVYDNTRCIINWKKVYRNAVKYEASCCPTILTPTSELKNLMVHITMTSDWAPWHLISPASPLFTHRLFGRRSKKTSKLRVTCLCVGNSPGTGEFPAQMASNAENVSIWWRHHEWHETPMI